MAHGDIDVASTEGKLKPSGNRTSRASHCEVVRGEENVATNCWKEVASGGQLAEVKPSFFIITF